MKVSNRKALETYENQVVVYTEKQTEESTSFIDHRE